MSDDYFSNDNDDEYWDDIYFEEHKDEFSTGRRSDANVGKRIARIFLIVFLMCVLTKSFSGFLLLFLFALAIFL